VTVLQFRFLGPLEIRCGDRQLSKPPTLKSQSLLAYLVLHRDQPQPRERLAGMFWGDRPERKARSSLSTALWHIRRCLPDEELVLSDLHTVQFHPQAELWLDVEEFESRASAEEVGSVESAVALYRGDFLDGFYDDWVINERYRLETLFAEVLEWLMTCREAREEHTAVLTTAVRLLRQDPLRESAHRAAMRAYCRLGRRNAALEQYTYCQEILQQELGVEPMPETTELYHEILDGRAPVGLAPDVAFVEEQRIETPVAPGRSPLDAALSTTVVGREGELDFLRRRWEKSRARCGGLVLISGEAGVGKTRLAEAFADRVRWKGARVLWGRCYKFDQGLPYQPFSDMLRSVLPALRSTELRDLRGWILEEVARLVPELSERAGIGEARPRRTEMADEEVAGLSALAPPASQERARLFDAITSLLTELASHGPLLITLEDLHWATESTLQLLHYLIRRLPDQPILAVGTFRSDAVSPGDSLLDLRRHLAQEDMTDQLCLSRLSSQATGTLLQEMSGAGQAIAPLAQRLHQETLGNPFFLMETIRALFQGDELWLEGGSWQGDFARLSEAPLPLPAGVRDVVQARLDHLMKASQDALRLAAVLGSEFDFDLLNATWDRGVEAALEALDELLRHRLLEENRGTTKRDYAFTHHKIQEVVYDGMDRRRRQHLHGLVGKTMAALLGPEAEARSSELAIHFEQGCKLDRGLTEKAIHHLSQAGDQARDLYACQEAIDYYQRALTLLKNHEGFERAARTLMKMGLTYHNAFDFGPAQRAYEQGFAFMQRAAAVEEGILPSHVQTLRISCMEPSSLDPAMAGDIVSIPVLDQLFSGLAEHSPDMEVVPDVAESWEILDRGHRYVFHLRDDVQWSDGTPVTGEDFEYAWKRVLNPDTGSPNATMLYDIKGARAYHKGEVTDPDSVGVQACDAATLVVELDEPAGYFLHVMAHSATYPVPRHAVDAHGEAWTEVGRIVTNGPFKLKAWQRAETLVLVKNARYHGRAKGNVQKVKVTVLVKPAAGLKAYQADRLDLLDMIFFPPAEIDYGRWHHAGEYVSGPQLYPSYVAFCLGRAPFDELRVRRAFALATDRKRLAGVALHGSCSPATGGIVPPKMPGHTPNIGPSYDPERARELLADAGFPGGRGLPVVTLMMHEDPLSPVAGKYLQKQWRSELGVKTELEVVEWERFFTRLQIEPPQAVLWGFVADYPDPDNVLRVGMGYVLPYTRWENEDYGNLVERAGRLTNQKKRVGLYREADRILTEEVPILPLAYMRSHLLVKPWVSRLPISPIRYWFWKDVTVESH